MGFESDHAYRILDFYKELLKLASFKINVSHL